MIGHSLNTHSQTNKTMGHMLFLLFFGILGIMPSLEFTMECTLARIQVQAPVTVWCGGEAVPVNSGGFRDCGGLGAKDLKKLLI